MIADQYTCGPMPVQAVSYSARVTAIKCTEACCCVTVEPGACRVWCRLLVRGPRTWSIDRALIALAAASPCRLARADPHVPGNPRANPETRRLHRSAPCLVRCRLITLKFLGLSLSCAERIFSHNYGSGRRLITSRL